MSQNTKTQVVKDLKNKTIAVSREFTAPLALVWRAHTEKELLDQWWGPAPWHAETNVMNFTEGGYWLYAMVSPENEKHWGRMNYTTIVQQRYFEIVDCFCNDNGEADSAMPTSSGKMAFIKTATGTLVTFTSTYSTEEQLQKIIAMGFEQGIQMCMDQLAVLLNRMEG